VAIPPDRGDFPAYDRALLDRMGQFLGHIEDMGGDERVYMLGRLAGALSRHLDPPRAGSMVKDPEAGDLVKVTGRIISIDAGTALVEVYRSDPIGIRVPVQCGALEHVEPAAGDDVAAGEAGT
jgi:hypothetical protein